MNILQSINIYKQEKYNTQTDIDNYIQIPINTIPYYVRKFLQDTLYYKVKVRQSSQFVSYDLYPYYRAEIYVNEYSNYILLTTPFSNIDNITFLNKTLEQSFGDILRLSAMNGVKKNNMPDVVFAGSWPRKLTHQYSINCYNNIPNITASLDTDNYIQIKFDLTSKTGEIV